MAALVGGGVAAFVRRREARGFGGRLSLERAPVIDRPDVGLSGNPTRIGQFRRESHPRRQSGSSVSTPLAGVDPAREACGQRIGPLDGQGRGALSDVEFGEPVNLRGDVGDGDDPPINAVAGG